jgi:crossover junction endodeoxyribonuclease RuvC
MANKILIGIDPGLAVTAWAESGGDSGIIQPSQSGMARLVEILAALQKAEVHLADGIAIEGYSFGSPYRAHQLGELGGGIRMWLWQCATPYIDVAPPTLKKFATGSGRAKKDELRLAVWKRWGKEFKTEHEVDAFVLAKIAEAVFGDPGPLTQFQSEVVKRCKQNLAAQTVESDNKSVKP